MRILSVVGARPEFIQAMPVSHAISKHHQEILVHTGQHYDYKMSQKFFDELDIPVPDYNLGVGSASQSRQTAEIMIQLEEVMLQEKPDFVVMRGDTNSSLAAALVAAKVGIPFAHIESGERSFNREMPEELNRLVADRLANLHFCVSQAAVTNLLAEGIQDTVHFVGDVMLDALLHSLPIARKRSTILDQLGVEPRKYALVTIHRPANTDNPKRLKQIIKALNSTSETIIMPIHPRTKLALSSIKVNLNDNIQVIEPMGYFDMLVLEENARIIATDSGGVQREAYYLEIPCLTLRDESEWVDTIATGWNILVGADQKKILKNWFDFKPPAEHPKIYGKGNASQLIVDIINESMGNGNKNSNKNTDKKKNTRQPIGIIGGVK